VQIDHNTVSGNGDNGIFMFDLLAGRISHNRAGGNGAGIDLEGGQHGSTGNQIAGNDTSRNLFAGIIVDNADQNLVSHNVSNGNLGAPGEGGGIIIVAANNNVVRANLVVGNHDVGIGVFEDQPGDTTHNTLARNTANRNGAHGIDAAVGAIDGGGNLAHGNTPLPNCLGVICH
jgi:parallel beta-helix repeat protein